MSLCGCRRYSIWRADPYQGADITSNTDYEWGIDHVYLLVSAQAYLANFLATFREYPQRPKAASFNLDDVPKKMQSPVEAGSLRRVSFPRRRSRCGEEEAREPC